MSETFRQDMFRNWNSDSKIKKYIFRRLLHSVLKGTIKVATLLQGRGYIDSTFLYRYIEMQAFAYLILV